MTARLSLLPRLALALPLIFIGSTASAVVTYVGNFDGNDCGGQGGFSNCYAGPNGTQQGEGVGLSPSIYKLNSVRNEPIGEQEFSTLFPSIDGTEFVITYNGGTNTLAFTYTPGADDPEVHFFTIKQAQGFALFEDRTAPITSFSANLDDYFPSNPGWSHITFFDTKPPIPEPGTYALLLAGLAGVGFMARRRKSA